jgi:hypothetical protein
MTNPVQCACGCWLYDIKICGCAPKEKVCKT